MTFYAQIETPVKQALDLLFSDVKLRSAITYRRWKDQTFDPVLKYNVNTFDEFTLFAIRLKHTDRSAATLVGNIEVGDEVYILQGTTAPANMSLKDEILTEIKRILKVKSVDEIFGLAVAVTVEGGAA